VPGPCLGGYQATGTRRSGETRNRGGRGAERASRTRFRDVEEASPGARWGEIGPSGICAGGSDRNLEPCPRRAGQVL